MSAPAEGLCIYKAGGAGLNGIGMTNCGLRNAGNGQGGGNQNSIELFFDQQVELLSYQYGSLRVGLGNPLITWGVPSSPLVSTEVLFRKQANTTYAFDNPFIVNANQIITITGTGGGGGTTTTQALLSQLVVRTVPPSPSPGSSVPGPFPLLGAGAAFGWSRRLRCRLKSPPSR